jgi:hypothetical protein
MKKFFRDPLVLAALAVFLLLVFLFVLPPEPHVLAQGTFAPLQCSSSAPFSSASSFQLITASNSNMLIYICSFGAGSIGGSDFSVVEGTGTTCGTNTKALFGGTTAAAGMGLAANGVYDLGSGTGLTWKTVVPGDNVCIIASGTGPLAGSVSYTQQGF